MSMPTGSITIRSGIDAWNMNKKLITFLPLLLLFLPGCRKNGPIKEPYTIRGRIVSEGTRYPVANARIRLEEEYYVEAMAGSSKKIGGFGPVQSDANGNYELVGQLHKNSEKCQILVFSEAGRGPVFFPVNLGGDHDVRIDTIAITGAQFFLTFESTIAPVNVNDSIYNIYFERPWGNQYFIGNTVLYAPAIYAPLRASYYGYAENILHYTVNKAGITQNFTDTLHVNDPFAEVGISNTIAW